MIRLLIIFLTSTFCFNENLSREEPSIGKTRFTRQTKSDRSEHFLIEDISNTADCKHEKRCLLLTSLMKK